VIGLLFLAGALSLQLRFDEGVSHDLPDMPSVAVVALLSSPFIPPKG
jgi:hypothetical protein